MSEKFLKHLFDNNRKWSEAIKSQDHEFFQKLAKQQSPEYLWIGCSDSRVPANEIVGMLPGELFVHRNVANIVGRSDLNCLAVMQFAVEVLGVKHIIVTGHYGCGGIKAAVQRTEYGLIDNWLSDIKDLYQQHHGELAAIEDESARLDRLCELNVIEQAGNVARTTIVQNAWKRGQELNVHGWIYGIEDGILRDLGVNLSGPDQLPPVYRFVDRFVPEVR